MFILASYADGDTGENAHPSNETLAMAIGSDDPRDARRVLERLEKYRLIEETGTKWHRGGEISVWRLRIDDDELLDDMADQNVDAARSRKATRSERNRRYYERRAGKTHQDPSEVDPGVVRRKQTRLKTEAAPTEDGNRGVLRRKQGRPKTGQMAPDQPIDQPKTTSPVDQPTGPHTSPAAPGDALAIRPSRFGRGVAGARRAESLAAIEPEPTLGEQLIDLVVPRLRLDPEDTRRAHTLLLRFADRWPRCLEMAEIAFQAAESRPDDTLEIGCFEESYDANFAIPLNRHIEKANPAA
nr:helix-turn-helix domain-containing protein [Amycolatopsis sp. SID8362]